MGIKISELLPVATPALSDVFPIVQSGVTYKESFTQLTSLFATAPVNDNITSMTGLTGTLKAPTGIEDADGNLVVSFFSNPSAVNYFTIGNGAAGDPVTISGQGSDANVSLSIYGKGTGVVALLSANTVSPVAIHSGTGLQHTTSFVIANTASSRAVTIPDYNGTMTLISKANGTEAANAVTASGTAGVITTSTLTTAAGANYAITWTNTFITTTSTILLTKMGGTNTTQDTSMVVTAGAGTSTLTIYNTSPGTALNGTIFIGYQVIP